MTEVIKTMGELVEKYDGKYAVGIDGHGDTVWVYENAYEAINDPHGYDTVAAITVSPEVWGAICWEGYIGDGPHPDLNELFMAEVRLCENLEQLFDLLKYKGEGIDDDVNDFTDLPNFSVHHEPTDLLGVWSYDDDQAIVGSCVEDFELVNYATGVRVWEGARDNEREGDFDEEYVKEYALNALNVYVTEEQARKIVDAEERWNVLCEAGEPELQNEWHHLCKDLRFTVFE